MEMAIAPPPDWQAVFSRHRSRITRALAEGEAGILPGGRYEHWDKLRHRAAPEGLSPEQWWTAVKAARFPLRRSLPMTDLAGRPFHFCLVDPMQEILHSIDSRLSGRIATDASVATEGQRDRFLVTSLIEEAVTSSQLEGAATTREVAVEMLRSGRKPRDHDERMIFNNYNAMATIRRWKTQPFSPHAVLELHQQVTEETLDDPDDAGRMQGPDEERVVVRDPQTGSLLHRPPSARHLSGRLERMCVFANRKLTGRDFLHPVLHAIVLHFWLAWDHPFVDGNGRTARALFYWKLLQSDYWLFEFISISTVLRKAPGQYKRAFLETESDENDLTYFMIHQLRVIARAMDQLEAYLERKKREIRELEHRLRTNTPLNHRQLALLGHALRNPGAAYTIRSHRRSHRVAYATARSDLMDLAEQKLLDRSPPGSRPIRFHSPRDLVRRIDSAPERK